jgi:hypothetical protein
MTLTLGLALISVSCILQALSQLEVIRTKRKQRFYDYIDRTNDTYYTQGFKAGQEYAKREIHQIFKSEPE